MSLSWEPKFPLLSFYTIEYFYSPNLGLILSSVMNVIFIMGSEF